MSGHSKWETIKRAKGANDAKRGVLFTKLGNQIAIAARGGTDPDTNFALRLAIDTAKSHNMPLANIERAIQRVADKSLAQFEEVVYEGYGPGGIAIVVECATDNRNRTFPEVKSTFAKNGGAIAEPGSVLFQFSRKGVIRVKASGDEAMLALMDTGTDDIAEDGDEMVLYTDPKALMAIRQSVIDAGYEPLDAVLTYVPNNTIDADEQTAEKVMKLLGVLDDLDDVTNTYTNLA